MDNSINRSTTSFLKELKVILLGDTGRGCSDAGSGKTSLIRSIMGVESSGKVESTIGVDFYKKVVKMGEKSQLRVQIWDTAGQEKYKSLSIFHLRGRRG